MVHTLVLSFKKLFVFIVELIARKFYGRICLRSLRLFDSTHVRGGICSFYLFLLSGHFLFIANKVALRNSALIMRVITGKR